MPLIPEEEGTLGVIHPLLLGGDVIAGSGLAGSK